LVAITVTMSIRRISLGHGYRYLLKSVARGDGAGYASSNLTRYYAESGTPPGQFLGAGLAGLDDGRRVAVGSQVTERDLFRLLGMLQDPVTGQPLGRLPRTESVDRKGAIHRPVAGFDLTFSVPKSVSVAWALGDAQTQAAIHHTHVAALEFVIRYAEANVFSSRSGKNGVRQEDVRGVVATAFDHWDSRSGDPQLHTHVAVINRVQTPDGAWRTLDSRPVQVGGHAVRAVPRRVVRVPDGLARRRLGARLAPPFDRAEVRDRGGACGVARGVFPARQGD